MSRSASTPIEPNQEEVVTTAGRVLDERGLPDAGIAADDECSTEPEPCRGQKLVDFSAFVDTPDEVQGA